MNAPTKVICSNCGYATNEDVAEDGVTTKVGRCCENLPRPYDWDSASGTYSRPIGERINTLLTFHEEDDGHGDEDDCDCPGCVASYLGLDEATENELRDLDADGRGYTARIRELGWDR